MAELAARDARIAARRARVQARLAAANSAKKDHRKSRLEIEQDAGVGDRQLSKSLHSLAEFRRKLKDEVKALRDSADFREYEHRMGETSKGEVFQGLLASIVLRICYVVFDLDLQILILFCLQGMRCLTG